MSSKFLVVGERMPLLPSHRHGLVFTIYLLTPNTMLLSTLRTGQALESSRVWSETVGPSLAVIPTTDHTREGSNATIKGTISTKQEHFSQKEEMSQASLSCSYQEITNPKPSKPLDSLLNLPKHTYHNVIQNYYPRRV